MGLRFLLGKTGEKFPSSASFGSCLGFAVPSVRAGAKLDLAPFVRLALVVSWGSVVEDTVPRTFDIKVS